MKRKSLFNKILRAKGTEKENRNGKLNTDFWKIYYLTKKKEELKEMEKRKVQSTRVI